MDFYDIKVKDKNGEEISLKKYKGKVLLIVNTATMCGFTPQYKVLEELYERYHENGFEILDFPCDQFGHQAPGTDDEIHNFCTAKYNTTFDQFKKIDVNGENESKLFTYLKENAPKEYIKGIKNKMAMKAISKISVTSKEDGDIHTFIYKDMVLVVKTSKEYSIYQLAAIDSSRMWLIVENEKDGEYIKYIKVDEYNRALYVE